MGAERVPSITMSRLCHQIALQVDIGNGWR